MPKELTDREFVSTLIKAGWKPHEAEDELARILSENESGQADPKRSWMCRSCGWVAYDCTKDEAMYYHLRYHSKQGKRRQTAMEVQL